MASSSSAFLSRSCIITRLAMEAKVRFAEAVEEGVEAVVVITVEEADAGLEVGETVELWELVRLGEVERGVLIGAVRGGFVETVLLGDTAGDKGFDFSKERGDSICFEMVRAGGREEQGDFLGSKEVGDFSCWVGEAVRLLEMGEGGICMGEGWEGPPRTGHDPWVPRAVGVDDKSFSIFPEI